MELFISFLYCCFLLTSGLGIHRSITHGHGDQHRRRHYHQQEKHEMYDHAFRPTKLFVFGDSYADTGNVRKSLGINSWKDPYGVTFPGKPAGRFSDGRVLTDYLAKLLGLKSPLAYEWMNLGGKKLGNGLNFAYGGSGVFNTLGNVLPNMSTQIDFFQKLMDQSIYTKSDLQSSLVFFCLSGNDYAAYLARDHAATPYGLRNFISVVINQLALNLKRMNRLGATKIAVTALQPLGCLPRMTQTLSFQQCNATQNMLVIYHNFLLQQSVAKLNNNNNKSSSSFFILDLYTSFTTVLHQKGTGDSQGKLKFETPLKPCCMGINSGDSCGSMGDENGEKMYTVCSDPNSSFFWDSSHPTQAGWHAVYTTLESGLNNFLNCIN